MGKNPELEQVVRGTGVRAHFDVKDRVSLESVMTLGKTAKLPATTFHLPPAETLGFSYQDRR
jgi:hypothetical protein